MSQHPDTDDSADDLKRQLQSLKPRTTIDRDQLLARLQADASAPPRLAAPQPAHSRRTHWWPMLTALSWLVTAGIWWNSTQTTASHGTEAAGVMAAASSDDSKTSPATVVAGSSGMHQLGESLDAAAPRTAAESPPLVQSQASTASPFWLTMLGIDIAEFTPVSAEDRWERMQAAADAPRQLTSVQPGSVAKPAATYASLRDEFDTPIRRNWFSH